VPTQIERMPLDVPAESHSAAGANAVLALHSANDVSATEVTLLG